MALGPEIGAALYDILGADHVSVDLAVRRVYGSWLTDLFYVVPDAVVFPACTGEVSELMRGAAACQLPIVHRSVESGPVAAVLLDAGGIALSLQRMNRILDVDLGGGVARIQPHVTAEQLRNTGLDLTWQTHQRSEPQSAYGGIVVGVEAVLPSGKIIRTGGGLLACALGDPEAAALLARPDGTLAVITELTICLDPSRAQPHIALAYFPSVPAACAAARTVMMSQRTPTHLHFLDRQAICQVEDRIRFGLRRDA